MNYSREALVYEFDGCLLAFMIKGGKRKAENLNTE
jgi:hypothetical protein